MIVCLCNRVSDRDIRASVADGVRCFEQLQDDTGVASSCGCCLDCARDVFEAAVAQCGQRIATERPVVFVAALAG